MVRAVASWGVEIGWQGQKEWRHEMTLLQNAAMRKTLGAVKGTSGRKASAIAAVEDVETFARAVTGRFLARTLCDPPRARIGVVDEGIAGKGQPSCGGECWRGQVDVVDLGLCKSSTAEVWERAIKGAGEGRLVVYTDGSWDGGGQVGGGWYAPENGAGSVAVGSVATVWRWGGGWHTPSSPDGPGGRHVGPVGLHVSTTDYCESCLLRTGSHQGSGGGGG